MPYLLTVGYGPGVLNVDPLIEHLTRVRDLPLPTAIDWLCEHHGLDVNGNQAVTASNDPNIYFDAGLSDAGVEAALVIHGDLRIGNQPLTGIEAVLVYSYDGARMLSIPFVKRPPSGGYRRPHWCPTLVKLA